MQKVELLTYGNYYHVYNRGVNSCDLFNELKNYEHFLRLYDKYINPVADTMAWVLMPNNFHLLVRIKEDIRYKYPNADRPVGAVRFETIKWETTSLPDLSACKAPDSVIATLGFGLKIPNPTKHFSHLFNAYAKYFNKINNCHGSLFERPFRRKKVDRKEYLKQLVIYIHNNPVHHDFCEHAMEYPWSSYLTCISVKPTKLQRETVVGWFDDMANFKYMHNQKIVSTDFDDW